MLLGPERVIETEGPANEILKRCDGTHSLKQIVEELSQLYTADRTTIERDVRDMLEELAGKGLIIR